MNLLRSVMLKTRYLFQEKSNTAMQKAALLYHKYRLLYKIAPHEEVKGIRSARIAFNVLHILTNKFFYKIEIKTPNTIKQEYANYKLIYDRYPSLRQFLPVSKFCTSGNLSYLKTELLFPVSNEKENLAISMSVLEQLRSCGQKKKISISELPFVQRGFAIAKEFLSVNDYTCIEKNVVDFLDEHSLQVGPVHNDLHQGNLMKDNNGAPKIIDLDCFSETGIQQLDNLYYHIEVEAQQKGYPWYPYLADYCKDDHGNINQHVKWEHDKVILALLFCLNRTGQENLLVGAKFGRESITNMYKEICLKK